MTCLHLQTTQHFNTKAANHDIYAMGLLPKHLLLQEIRKTACCS